MADEPTPQEVTDLFVRTYYKLLCVSPGQLHEFYEDSSIVMRPGPDGAMISFTTMEEIKEHVLSSVQCKGSEIFSFDTQRTSNNGLFVLVNGRLTMENDEIRRFSQSFFLAPMKGVCAYFVENDVFRFLEEQETVIMCMGDVSIAVSSSTTDDVSTKDVQEETLPKKTFLSVVNSLSENTDPFKEPPAKNESKKNDCERKKNTRHIDNVNETSIFVGNVARGTKPEELYEAFKSFGPIKDDGVHVKMGKQNRWYAFIQFGSSSSSQSAIKASTVRMGNRSLNVEKKKRNNDSGSRKSSQESPNANGSQNNGQKANGQNSFWGTFKASTAIMGNRSLNVEEKKRNNGSGNRKFSQESPNTNGSQNNGQKANGKNNFWGTCNFNRSNEPAN